MATVLFITTPSPSPSPPPPNPELLLFTAVLLCCTLHNLQIESYAARKGCEAAAVEKWLAPVLAYDADTD